MTNLTFKAIAAGAVIGMAALTVAPPAEAGRGYRGGHHYRGGGGGGDALAAGIIGLGVGAIIGSALTPREVYVTPPPPPPPRAYYGAASYGGYGGPPPWTPGWYRYCQALHGPYFDANSGYYQGGDGGVYFCR
jgi:hypothetical protein